MGRLISKFLTAFFSAAFLAGCSVATTDVTSLLSNLNSFKLTSNDLRIDDLSDLSNITIAASCSFQNTAFQYELTDVSPNTWDPIPASASGFFTSINDQCATNSTFNHTLDLTSTPPFSTMAIGQTFRLRIKDTHMFGITVTEEFRITYSMMTLSENGLVNGQGLGSPRTSGSYTLKGRVTNKQQYPMAVSGSYTLQGKASFE